MIIPWSTDDDALVSRMDALLDPERSSHTISAIDLQCFLSFAALARQSLHPETGEVREQIKRAFKAGFAAAHGIDCDEAWEDSLTRQEIDYPARAALEGSQ